MSQPSTKPAPVRGYPKLWQPLNPPQRDWQGKRVWLVGASSGIGRATASALHHAGAIVTVSARSHQALADFVAQHPGSQSLVVDVADVPSLQAAARTLQAQGAIDCVLFCAGHYAAQRATQLDAAELHRHVHINYTGALHLLEAVVPVLQAQGHGHLSLVASVAGYRGLPNALAYGPTKAALINLAETLWLDLRPLGIGVSLVCPGFVQTPMTAANPFPMPALISPEQAALGIVQGWAQGRFEIHFPKRFTRAMQLLRLLPDRLYFYLAGKIAP